MEGNYELLSVIDRIRNKISTCNITGKGEIFLEMIMELERRLDLAMNVDLSLREYMSETSNEVYSSEEFASNVKNISDDSLIIYVKKAELYKVYGPEELDDYCQDSSTHYRKREYGPVYEVVRDANSQKLMIVISDTIQDERLQTFKSKIFKFIKYSKKEFAEATTELKIYNNDNETEFVFSSIRFDNIQEKEIFIEDFTHFMRMEGHNEIASKIQLRAPKSNIAGARLYKIPELKTLIESHGTSSMLDQLITTSSSSAPVVINNNTFNINIGNSTVNNVRTKKIVNVAKLEKKTLRTFYKFIYDTRPDWYEENKFVEMEIIADAYREYFNESEIQSSVISKKLNGELFTKSTRSKGTTKKKLHAFEILRDHF